MAGAASGQLVDRTKEPKQGTTLDADLTLEKRADIFMARKMFRDAQESYKLALDNDPQSPRLYNKLGIAYHQQLDLDAAPLLRACLSRGQDL